MFNMFRKPKLTWLESPEESHWDYYAICGAFTLEVTYNGDYKIKAGDHEPFSGAGLKTSAQEAMIKCESYLKKHLQTCISKL